MRRFGSTPINFTVNPVGLTRSEQMSRIRGSNTKPELVLRTVLAAHQIEMATQVLIAGIRVDMANERQRLLVFIDGCFWHGCPEHYVRPRSHASFWAEKLQRNVDRDRQQTSKLESLGWRVLRIWEHEIFVVLPDVLTRIQLAGTGSLNVGRALRVTSVAEMVGTNDEIRRLEDLRNSEVFEVIVGPRVTAKWRRQRSM
jgi:DNA mismatch endonuclease (patch repair protein)